MGRPIKKKWFSAKAGSVAGNLTIQVADDGAGGTVDEVIIKQSGTGVYDTASGRYKLVEGPAVHVSGDGLATLLHNGRYVRRINQYRVTYFDDDAGGPSPDDDIWRDGDGSVVGTFVPALTAEGAEPASVSTVTESPTPKEDEVVEECEPVQTESQSAKRRSKAKKDK